MPFSYRPNPDAGGDRGEGLQDGGAEADRAHPHRVWGGVRSAQNSVLLLPPLCQKVIDIIIIFFTDRFELSSH